MTKPKKDKKPTLKEEYFKMAMDLIVISYPETWDKIWNFFEPHLKKQPAKPGIEIPAEEVQIFNNHWPKEKLPTDHYGRCNEVELTNAFKAFFKAHPTYTDWTIIHNATATYLHERQMDNWEYTKRSKYFVRKENKDKSVDYLLAEYYQRIQDGVQEEPKQQGFEPRVM